MSESHPEAGVDLEIITNFVRGRNVLFAEADFGSLYMAYYLHLNDHNVEMAPENDAILKQALAGFALHCVSRPHNEIIAWTVNLQDPLLNLFLGGDNEDATVVGRVFTDNVKKAGENVFYQELVRGDKPLHRSVVPFEGPDIFVAIEEFYRRSEQRPARFFQLAAERYAIVTAHPDFDEEWFAALTVDEVRSFKDTEIVNPLETRSVSWKCGCDQGRILKALEPMWKADSEELFLWEELIEVNCPRCAGKYRITREMMEAFEASQSR